MQKCLRREYDDLTDVIYSEAVIFKPAEQMESADEKRFQPVEYAVWDTGAQVSIISPRIVEALSLKPIGQGMVMGIGGDGQGEVYNIHVGLPNGKVFHDINVISYDIEEYDILIGMDIIKLTDFLVTNNPRTVFSLRYPSEGGELK